MRPSSTPRATPSGDPSPTCGRSAGRWCGAARPCSCAPGTSRSSALSSTPRAAPAATSRTAGAGRRARAPGRRSSCGCPCRGGLPEPRYGGQLQDRALAGLAPEGKVDIVETEERGRYPDGTRYRLRRPRYRLSALRSGPLHPQTRLSARMPPALLGLGLLEAVPGRARGRFGWKASAPSLEHQIAQALREDLGCRAPRSAATACAGSRPTPGCSRSRRGGAGTCRRSGAARPSSSASAAPPATSRSCAPLPMRPCPSWPGRRSIPTPTCSSTTSDPTLPTCASTARRTARSKAASWRTAPLWGLGLLKTVDRRSPPPPRRPGALRGRGGPLARRRGARRPPGVQGPSGPRPPGPAGVPGFAVTGPISRCSQALASLRSRSTVAWERPRTSAVSSMVRPPKKRSSTMRALRSSSCARACERVVEPDQLLGALQRRPPPRRAARPRRRRRACPPRAAGRNPPGSAASPGPPPRRNGGAPPTPGRAPPGGSTPRGPAPWSAADARPAPPACSDGRGAAARHTPPARAGRTLPWSPSRQASRRWVMPQSGVIGTAAGSAGSTPRTRRRRWGSSAPRPRRCGRRRPTSPPRAASSRPRR